MPKQFDDDLLGAEIFEFDLPELADDEPVDDAIEEEIQGIVTRQIERALTYREENVEPDQVEATDYYYGRPFGNEEEGRSKVVSTVIRDAVLQIMPSLLRIFFGGDQAVEYRPRGPEDVEGARLKTEYVNMIVQEDNEGFLSFHSAFKDALVRRLGVIKYWWDEFHRVESHKFTGLDETQVLMLNLDEEVEVIVDSIAYAGEGEPDPATGELTQLFDVDVRRRIRDGRAKFAAIPPEEFVWTSDARSLDDAVLVAHVREVEADELIAMGVPEDMVEDARGKTRPDQLYADDLHQIRNVNDDDHSWFDDETELPEATQKVLFAEAYMLFDGDEDGVAELRKFECVGPKFEIVPDEYGDRLGTIVSCRPFALFTPEPEPHTIMGLSLYDLLKDLQRIKSQIERATLDSLGLSVEPQQEVVANMVNMKDLLSPELSGIIRVRAPGQIREVKHQFVGPDTLPILDYYDRVAQKRSGQNDASAGLDADALQSSTRAAVNATITAAQARVEMIARIFAETGVRQLFKGLLKLIVENQDRPRMVRLSNQYVEIDPRSWDANMDVQVNVALGTGLVEEKIAMLGMIAQKQMELLQLGSPIVGNVQVRATLAKIVELAGWKNADEFFKPWGEQEEQQMQEQLAQQPPQPDPATMIAQAEVMKAQASAQEGAQKLSLQQQEMYLKDDRERDKIARDAALREREIEMKYQVEIEDARLARAIEADRAAMDADIKKLQAQSGPQQG